MGKDKGAKSEWLRVTKRHPCAVCGSIKFCTFTADGSVAKCMDIESSKEAGGALGGWIHKTDGEPITVQQREKKPPIPQAEWQVAAEKAYHHDSAAKTRERLSACLGVSVEALEKLNVGFGFDDHRKMGHSTWPERTNQLQTLGIVRRYWEPVRSGVNKLASEGGRSGLFIAKDWWKPSGPIFLVEGGSDTAALLTVGVCVIGRPSNLGGVNLLCAALVGHHKRPIVVVAERDEKPTKRGKLSHCPTTCKGCGHCFPGLFGAKHTAANLQATLKRPVLWAMPPEPFKDSREFLMQATGRTFEEFAKQFTKQTMRLARKST